MVRSIHTSRAFLLAMAALVLIAPVGTAAPASLTREALVDLNRVTTAFMKDSKDYRDVLAVETQYNATVDRLRREIAELQQQRLRAQEAQSSGLLRELTDKISEKEGYLNDYRRLEGARVAALKEKVATSDAFLVSLIQAIQFVAEAEGFAAVRKITSDYLYYTAEVDITDKVILRMLKNR